MQEVSVDEYQVGKFLGGGKFGRVYVGKHRENDQLVALKIIAKKDQFEEVKKQEREVALEMEAMMRVEHENVLRIFGVDWNAELDIEEDSDPAFVLVMELARGGVLFDLLFKCGGLPEEVARTYFQQMVNGLEACHNCGVAHRDLKPENVLLDDDFRIKIADFGLANIHDDMSFEHLMETQCGTLSYLAPEVIKGKLYTTKADIFSLGVVLFVLVTKLMPFEYATGKDWWFNQIKKGRFDMFWMAHEKSAGKRFDDGFKDLVNALLDPNPDRRPTLEQILQFDWMQGETLNQEAIKERMTSSKKKKKRRFRSIKNKIGLKKGSRSRGDIEFEEVSFDENGLPNAAPNAKAMLGAAMIDEEEDGDVFDAWGAEEIAPELGGDHVSCYTEFRTTSKASTLINAIGGVLGAAKCKYRSTTFELSSVIDYPDGRSVEFEAAAYQDVNEDLRLVQFRRLNGDAFLFNDLYEQIMSAIGGMVYEDLDEEEDELF